MDKDGFGFAGSVKGRALFAAQVNSIRRRFRHEVKPGKRRDWQDEWSKAGND